MTGSGSPQIQASHLTNKEFSNWKIYAMKQIRIGAVYRAMVPRPRLVSYVELNEVPDKMPLIWHLGILHRR